MKLFAIISALSMAVAPSSAFTVQPSHKVASLPTTSKATLQIPTSTSTTTSLRVTPDLEVVSLVAGQENYGLGIVALGEAIWSFSEAPSFSHAKVLVPAIVAAIVLFAVSGPMVTNSSDPAAIKLGLEIASGVSVGLGASYVARLLAPFSPSAKEIAFGGLLLAVAGFFSFSQNLLVDEFIQLPDVPNPLPEGFSIFPKNEFS